MNATLAPSFNTSSNNVFNCLFPKVRIKFIEVRQSIELFISIVKVERAVTFVAILEQ